MENDGEAGWEKRYIWTRDLLYIYEIFREYFKGEKAVHTINENSCQLYFIIFKTYKKVNFKK